MLWSRNSKDYGESTSVCDEYSLYSTIMMMHMECGLPDNFKIVKTDHSGLGLYVGDICVADMDYLYVAFRKWVTDCQKVKIEKLIRSSYKSQMDINKVALDAALMRVADKMEEVKLWPT